MKQKLNESIFEVEIVFVIWCGWLIEVKSGTNLHSFKMNRGDVDREEKAITDFVGTFSARF